MTGFSDYASQRILQHAVGKTSWTMPSTVALGLFTAVGSDGGTGFTEVSGGSYARVAVQTLWNAASGSAPSTITNSASITFPAATANWGTIIGWGLYDAASAGNLLFWDYMGNFNWIPFSCTSASPGVLTSPAHGFANGDSVVVSGGEYGGVLPTTGGSWTGLLTVAGVTTDTFNVGVNTTSTGDGMLRKVASQAINTGVTASFAASTLTLALA